MPRYKLTIAYDGTDFHGWQKQEPPAPREPGGAHAPAGEPALEASRPGRIALRTVQAVVERAVREVVREPVLVEGASRTDAGVHARGQIAAFTCSGDDDEHIELPGPPRPTGVAEGESPPPDRAAAGEGPEEADGGAEPRRGFGWPLSRGTDRLLRAINSRLPEDVLVVDAAAVAAGFKPVTDAVSKGYSYTLHVTGRDGGHRPLWDRRFVHHVWVPLDVGRMNEAAARLIGEHDFAAFAAAGHGRLSTVRTVFSCAVREVTTDDGALPHDLGQRMRIDVSGSGFLWNMVRIIAGTLVEVGRGRLTPEDVSAALTSGDRRKAGPTLPARGLCLEWIRYGGAEA